MKNLTISLPNRPGTLAEVGEVLGKAGISVEGGGMFVIGDIGIANFLVSDSSAGRKALQTAGISVIRDDDVVMLRLDQEEAGQLGKLLRRMADANVNVLTQYSDHDHQLVLVVDDLQAGQAVAGAWMQERAEKNQAPAAPPVRTRLHHYQVEVRWTGNLGSGTSGYASYSRSHHIVDPQKGVIEGSSDPAFRGDARRYNPEELLVASASACHMLSYLHLCAVNDVIVLSYEDHPTGEMKEILGGSGAFTRIDLHPKVTISPASDNVRAEKLHEEAHKNCFIANSLHVPVFNHPQILRTIEN